MKTKVLLSVLVSLAMSTIESACAESTCAKDMFFDQLESPTEALNSGIKYWIQLRRKGKSSLVDNRTVFYSGDEIRFQVIPNITGYAYAVLTKGSTGGKKVLFPNVHEPQGKVVSGRTYFLPEKGYLQFDKNTGTENVRLVISRHPVSSSALLDSGSNYMRIASNSRGDKPIQNQNCVVAFGSAEGKSVDFPVPTAQPETVAGEPKDANQSEFAKDLNYVPAVTKSRVHLSRRKRHSVVVAKKRRSVIPPVTRPGSVTVVNIEPTENLIAEIQLMHK